MGKRDVLLVIDGADGLPRHLPISLRAIVCSLTLATSFPVLVGLGARMSVRAEIQRLQTAHKTLEDENASYRSTTRAFTEQIQSLQSVVDELQLNSEGRAFPPLRRPAGPVRVSDVDRKTPGNFAVESAMSLPPLSSPVEILDVLSGVLQALANRLPSIERTVKRREELAAAAPSIWPARGWLTASFGLRNDPLTGEQGFHQGIDISAPTGQPVYVTGDGVVDTASYSGDYGNLVVVQHSFGLSTRYGHLSHFAVAPGVAVKRGDVIGYAGATGRATGSHVHYEILVNGAPLDPLRILTTAIPQ